MRMPSAELKRLGGKAGLNERTVVVAGA